MCLGVPAPRIGLDRNLKHITNYFFVGAAGKGANGLICIIDHPSHPAGGRAGNPGFPEGLSRLRFLRNLPSFKDQNVSLFSELESLGCMLCHPTPRNALSVGWLVRP